MATSNPPTITIYNALRSVGIEDAAAQSVAEAITVRDDLASKLDLERSIVGVNERITDLKVELERSITDL